MPESFGGITGLIRVVNTALENKVQIAATGVGIVLAAIAGLAGPLPAEEVFNGAGQMTLEQTTDGTQSQSGSLLVHSGSTVNGLKNNGHVILNGEDYLFPPTAGSNTNVLSTNGAGTLSWVTQTGGGGGAWSGTGALQTAFDKRYIEKQGGTMTGALTVKANMSGSSLYVSGTMTGQKLAIRGLTDLMDVYDNTGKVLDTLTSSNAAETNWFYDSGASLAELYNNDGGDLVLYDNHNGNTMEFQASGTRGPRWYEVANASQSQDLVQVWKNDLSGWFFNVSAQGNVGINTSVRDRARLSVVGTMSGSSLQADNSITGAGLSDCSNSVTSKLLWSSSTGKFSCGTDQGGSSYTAGQGLTLTSSSFKVNATLTGSSVKFTTMSGDTINAQTNLTSSGAAEVAKNLLVKGTISGASLYVGSNISGDGLSSCSNATTSKLLWNSGTGRFSCGTDQNTTAWSNTGSLQGAFDARYLRTSGGTETGAVTVNITNGGPVTIGINNLNGYSGSTLHVEKNLTSSGSFEVGGNSRIKGAETVVGAFSGAQLQIQGLASYVLGNVSLGSSASAHTKLDVYGSMSGSSLTVDGTSDLWGAIQQHVSSLTSYILGKLAINRSSIAHSGDQMEVNGTLSGTTVIATTLSGTIVRSDVITPRPIMVEPFGSGTSIATGSGKVEIMVDPVTMSGMKLTGAYANVLTAGTTNATTVQIRDITKGNTKLLTTPINIDSGTLQSRLSSTQPAFAGTVLSGYDTLTVDIPAVSTTAPKGLVIDLIFTK